MTSEHAFSVRQRRRVIHAASLLLATLCGSLSLLASLTAPAARAAASLTWSPAASFDAGGTPSAVSCASESTCVAVAQQGEVFDTSDPTAATPTWTAVPIDSGQSLNAVSCASGGPCVAVDGGGDAIVGRLVSGSVVWSSPVSTHGGVLTGVSCPSASLCVAVDEEGDVLASTEPKSAAWKVVSSDAGRTLLAVSCASTALCVAVDGTGEVISSTEPTTAEWTAQKVDSSALIAISCPASGTCVADDAAGDALASVDPGASHATWSLTPLDGEPPTGVSCAASGLCVIVDKSGHAFASGDPTSPTPEWSSSSADPGESLSDVACLSGGFCIAVDSGGRSVSARVAPPTATTSAPPGEVTDGGATLTGIVDPNDATITACSFEYGEGPTGGSYESSVPCSQAPIANAENQGVSATVSGLYPNTTYRYRLVASSLSGTGTGANETFTTATSTQIAIIHPNPSIAGTPAVGQTLTCHPGTPAGTSPQLSYTWVRDQIPIVGALRSTYAVKGQDSGHHLQCQVTATDGGGSATALSGFVTIPAGGAPTSAGETSVGNVSFKNGRVSVPIVCSTLASSGCEVTLKLTAVETLSGRRVVAVAAHAGDADGHAAATRHTTITLAGVRARLARGAHVTLTATLSSTARRLLTSRRRFSAYATVRGTVVGVIEAQLAQQVLTLHAPTHGVSSHATSVPEPLRWAADRARSSSSVPTSTSVLAATPYMGWDTYFALGGNYTEASILQQASQLISLGLEKRGYRYVWLDVGWWHGTRNADGEITVSSSQWPHGLAWLTRTLHAAGFLVGLYTDAGPNGCGGAGEGSYGHYQQDVNTFAAWGFDAVKVDFCGGAEYHLDPAGAYAEFHEAIVHNASHRAMLLSICNFQQPEQYGEGHPPLDESAFASYSFGPTVGNSWRTDTDVGAPGHVYFSNVLRNVDADAAAPQAAGPGHWNDPDYLAPDQGMSATQFRSQLSMWAMLAAPLMISDNLTKISANSLAAVQNSEVLAIDQDPAGVQGTLLSSSGDGEVWVKPLLGGSRAIALLNRGSSPIDIQTSASAAGLPSAASYALRNVWTHTTSSTFGAIQAVVPGDSTLLLRVSPR